MAGAKIYEAISNVMKEVGAVGKDDTNPVQKYKYRSIDAVMNALHPTMSKYHVFVTPEVLEEKREERTGKQGGVIVYSILKVKYTFYTDDGSSVEAVVMGEAMDSGDKSMNKAMSAAFKYACFQTFCIPTEDMIDTETESPEVAPKSAKIRKETPEEAKKNEEMAASVDPKLIPSKDRTKEEMRKNIEEEMKRTGKNEKTALATMGIDSWEQITDAKYISIMNLFAKIK